MVLIGSMFKFVEKPCYFNFLGGNPVCCVNIRPGFAFTLSAAEVPSLEVEFFFRALV